MSSELQPSAKQQAAVGEETALALTSAVSGPLAFLVNPTAFNHLWRVATGYSRSALVPMAFRGKVDDCFIACQLAVRLRVDPFMLMQSMYVVNGRPGFEAKLAIALLNASEKIRGTLKTSFSGEGENYGCRAWAIDKDTGEKIEGPKVDWKMVKSEGWNQDKKLRDGSGVQKSKWNTMPDLMFVYRAASFFIRTNYPEVLMGMQTAEELEDTGQSQDTVITNQAKLDLLLSAADGTGEKAPETEANQDQPETIDVPVETEPVADNAEQSDIVAQWIEEVSGLKTIGELTETRRTIPAAMSADGKAAIHAAIDAREAAIRATRGERTNGK